MSMARPGTGAKFTGNIDVIRGKQTTKVCGKPMFTTIRLQFSVPLLHTHPILFPHFAQPFYFNGSLLPARSLPLTQARGVLVSTLTSNSSIGKSCYCYLAIYGFFNIKILQIFSPSFSLSLSLSLSFFLSFFLCLTVVMSIIFLFLIFLVFSRIAANPVQAPVPGRDAPSPRAITHIAFRTTKQGLMQLARA